jgi:hypothetical protein
MTQTMYAHMNKIKIEKQKQKKNPHTLLVGMQASATTLEKNIFSILNLFFPQKIDIGEYYCHTK